MARVMDTDIVSFQFKGDSRAAQYRRHLIGHIGVISFMTLAELCEWTNLHRWGQSRRDRLDRHVGKFVIYYADQALCRQWAKVRANARRNGRPIDGADAWVAATALAAGVPLVTHNPKDYDGVDGLTILSEAVLE
jgi:tRNA(fMet)-specific endonuclease VapC